LASEKNTKEQKSNWKRYLPLPDIYTPIDKTSEVVTTVPKLVGSLGCTLFVIEENELQAVASSALYIQRKIEQGTFKPNKCVQDSINFMTQQSKPYWKINDRKKDVKLAEWLESIGECEVGEEIHTCDRFLSAPIFSHKKDVIGLIRTVKMSYHDPFTDIDGIMLKVFAERLSFAIEFAKDKEKELQERKQRIKNTFSSHLVDKCKNLEYMNCRQDIVALFKNLEDTGDDIRIATLEKLSQLWKKTLVCHSILAKSYMISKAVYLAKYLVTAIISCISFKCS
jgi:hypothetical protein